MAILAGMVLSFACLVGTEEPEKENVDPEEEVEMPQEEITEIMPADSTPDGSRDWDANETYLLAKIAMAEAEGESTEGKALVVCVVLNRVLSEDFEGTIQGVIFEKNQFSTVEDGGRWWTTEPNDDCYAAVRMVMEGWDESQGALYFESSEEPTWHSRNLEFIFKVGKHKFYR
jgi:N-acetylmuramoyl-L-alanine amidase